MTLTLSRKTDQIVLEPNGEADSKLLDAIAVVLIDGGTIIAAPKDGEPPVEWVSKEA